MYIGKLVLIAPSIYLIVAAIIVLLLGVVASRRPDKGLDHYLPVQYLAPALTFVGVILAGGVVWHSMLLVGKSTAVSIGNEIVQVPVIGLFIANSGYAQLTVDPFAAILSFVAFAGTLLVMLLSLEHFGERQVHKAEYYALLMFAAAAAALASAASDLIALYLSIEFLSLTSYVLAAYAKTDRRSGEAGLKYFLCGAACSAIMLYGMSILFGVTGGSTAFAAIAKNLTSQAAMTGAAWVGVMFVLVGLCFKLALTPFHFWAPDAYEGAPTPVTAFLSVVSKAAGLAVIVRFLLVAVLPDKPYALSWYWILVVLTAATMFYGNLVAIAQRNIKRMLAYSGIAQMGYLMVGVLTAMHAFAAFGQSRFGIPTSAVRADIVDGGSIPWDMQGVLIYILAYLFMNIGAFAVVVAVGKQLGSNLIESYAGMMRRSPLYASALTVFLVSLAGVPPTAGFVGKLFIFGGAVRAGVVGRPELVTLAVLGVINSVISAYYYLNVVRLMFFRPSDSKLEVRAGWSLNAAVVLSLAVTLGLILLAGPLSLLTGNAAYAALVSMPR